MSNLTDLYARDHQCAEVSKLNEVINMFAAEVSVMRNVRKRLCIVTDGSEMEPKLPEKEPRRKVAVASVKRS